MNEVKVIGRLNSSFQWSIPDVFSLAEKNCDCYRSPDFEFGDATWCLDIHPSSYYFCSTWLSLYLVKRKSESSNLVVTYTLGIKDRNGEDYIPRGSDKREFLSDGDYWGWNVFLSMSKLLEEREQFVPEDVLTVTCTLSLEKSVGEAAQTLMEERNIEEGTKEKENANIDDKEYDEKYIFRIPKGIDKMSHDFKGLLLKEQDCDVILKVKDREFRAHKLILGARSPVLCSMFQHDTVERNSGVVDIPDCDPDAFQDFLLYLYYGRVEKMSSSNVLHLYSVADKYAVEALNAECVGFMQRELSVETFGDVIALALRHREQALIEAATSFFTNNVKKIIETVQWQSFINENPSAANELHIKALKKLVPE